MTGNGLRHSLEFFQTEKGARLRAFATLALIFGLLAATSNAQANTTPRPVLATTGMVADLAQRVGGACVEVNALMGPGIDPHLYQPSAADVRLFHQAELVLYNGLGLEGQLGPVLARLGERRATLAVAKAAARRGPRELLRVADGREVDPHVWMDAGFWAQAVEPVRHALSEVARDCAPAIEARARQYAAELMALDAWMAAAIATIPADQRVLITAHDAFGYFGRAYDIDVRGIQGISTSAEAGVRDIQSIAGLIVERQIPALFVESTINPRTIEAVIEAVRERGGRVEKGGTLYGDALGEADSSVATLVGMLVHNVRMITTALGGTPPALPEALRE